MYTDEEICLMFRNADERQDRVKLLSELSSLSKKEVVKILNKYGITVNEKQENKAFVHKQKQERFLELYEKGWTDKKISTELQIAESTVQYWRSRIGKPSQKEIKMNQKDKFLGLYEKGWTDVKIAGELGLCQSTASRWRIQLKLPSNTKKSQLGMN